MHWSDIQFDPRGRPCASSPGCGWSSSEGWPSGKSWCEDEPGLAAIFAVLALTIGPLGLIRPEWVRLIYVGWMVLAFPIGWTVSQVMLAVMFYGLFTPIGLVFRLLGRDPLHRSSPPRAGIVLDPQAGTGRPAPLLQTVLSCWPLTTFTIRMMMMSKTKSQRTQRV